MKKNDSNNDGNDFATDAGGAGRKNQIRLKTLGDVRRFLGRVLNDLDANRIQESKAKALGYLCSIMKDILKDSELEARITKLETEVKKNEY